MDGPMDGHMGPIPLGEGVTFTQRMSGRVWRETGVRAAHRSRSQWGVGRLLTLAGPVDRLLGALDLVTHYGSVPMGSRG